MANVQKYTKSATGHMCSHYDRSAKNISNENINYELTKENYNLANNRNISQIEFINKRCSEVKCLNRENVNVMCSWVVTAPKDLKKDKEKMFFKSTYDFLNNRYGEENVISSHVHMDENQPHMHYAFVPVITDKKGIKKVSAKECINKKALQVFHKDLDKYMENVFGHSIGILNAATKDGNKSIEELKRKSAVEILEETNIKARQIIKEAGKTNEERLTIYRDTILEIQNKIKVLELDYEAKKRYVDGFEEKDINNWASMKKSLTGKIKYEITPEKWVEIIKLYNKMVEAKTIQQSINKSIKEFKDDAFSERISDLKNVIDDLKQDNEKIKAENKDVKQENRKIYGKYNNLFQTMKDVFKENKTVESNFNRVANIIEKRKQDEIKQREEQENDWDYEM